MAILIDEKTNFLIQGITGKEGSRSLGWMQSNSVPVLAGVTPGKGGQEVDGVPVYDTVAEALSKHPDINAVTMYVPPKFVLGAAKEAILEKIPLIHIIAEGVPTQDTARIIELSRIAGVRVVGPSSIGIISPGKSVVGSIGGGNLNQFLAPGSNEAVIDNGGVAVLSKSGGMANTVANMLTEAGIPQTTVAGLGGDRFIGTTFEDLVSLLAEDEETRAVVIIGEIGGAYEENFARVISEQQFNKPVVAFISGIFAETLPQGVAFGHAGAIVSKTIGSRAGKIDALSRSGVKIAQSPADIVGMLMGVLGL